MLQQENKTDFNSVIGFALIAIVLFWFLNEQAKVQEVIQMQSSIETSNEYKSSDETGKDSIILSSHTEEQLIDFNLEQSYGAFASQAIGNKNPLVEKLYLENDLVKIEIDPKGARITSVFLKEYQTFDSLPLNLIREDVSNFNLMFWSQNRRLQTSDFIFDTNRYNQGNREILSMRLNVQEGRYLEFLYALAPNSYRLDYNVNIVGLDGLIDPNHPIDLNWSADIPRQELNKDNEAMNACVYYFLDGEADNLSYSSSDSETIIKPDWIAFKSQYFSSVLSSKSFSKEVKLTSSSNIDDEAFLKNMSASTTLSYEGGTKSYDMEWYFVPNHVTVLKSFDIGLESLVPLGWSIIGWINKYVVINIFHAFENLGFGYGIIILLMALLIKILLFPFTYKSYTSMAKMRVLKPQIDAINDKFEDHMKRQQETMNLYRKTGVNPLGGCIPMLFQMPILFALFRFFPASIELRQQSFLWANDLSTYDSILDLGFNIPFYGDHISLFTLLMTATTVLQMKYSTGMSGSNAQMPQMKYMMYFMPIIFLGVMNNYAAALSYYYFLANLITFAQQKIIASMTDDAVILAKMEDHKLKSPKGKSSFQVRLEKMMKEQQEAKKKK